MPTTIFNEECDASLSKLRELAASLRATTVGATAGLNPKPTTGELQFTVTRSLPEVVLAIRDAGQRLSELLTDLESKVETQLVDFFRAMRDKVEDENSVLRATKSLLPTDPTLLKHLQVVTTSLLLPQDAAALSGVAGGGGTNRDSPQAGTIAGGAKPPPLQLSFLKSPARSHHHYHTHGGGAAATTLTPSAVTSRSMGKELATDTLRATLLLQLQSAMQLCEATVGAVYLQSTEGVTYLHRVCGINAAERLPLDVSPASGSTIATVLQHNMGCNISRSRHNHPDGLQAYQSATKAVRESVALRITNGLILPIGDLGCIMLADKGSESQFSELDEHVVWSAAIVIRGLLQRYPIGLLMGTVSPALHQALQQHAMLPPFAPIPNELKRTQNALSPEDALSAMAPGIERVPRLPKKLVMLRTDDAAGFQTIMSRDLASIQKCAISDEDLLEAAVPYVNNLEALWRKAIDGMTEVRLNYEKKEKESTAKSERIVELEVELRLLNRQLFSMKTDIQRIRAVLPSHLQSTDRGGDGVAEGGTAASPTAGTQDGGGGGSPRNHNRRSSKKVGGGGGGAVAPGSPSLPMIKIPHTVR